MQTFTDEIASFIAGPDPLTDANRMLALAAIEDTLAVALAGWSESVSAACRRLYAGGTHPLIDGSTVQSAENAALVQATAGHALDFDDVHLASTTHPSVVIAPALLAAAHEYPATRTRLLHSFAVGVAVNVTLGEAMGFEHYRRGWHATSTIGALAAAAAVSHMLALDIPKIRSALALAAAQAAGTQRNFGTSAKPLQAGFASAAGLRAALLAQAAVRGDQDIFGPGGFFDLYSAGARPVSRPTLDVSSISVKLYPCCYAAHRMIAAALAVRDALTDVTAYDFQVTAPSAQLQPLRVTDPKTGLEAKFCAPYIVATALLEGQISLADFEDGALGLPERRALMQRVRITAKSDALESDTLDAGAVTLSAWMNGRMQEERTIRFYPGSPKAPATAAQRDAKIRDCLTTYNAAYRENLTIEAFRQTVAQLCGLAD